MAPLKLYLSQANQGHNAGPGGYTEKAGMDAIIRSLVRIFAEDPRFVVKHNVAGQRIDTAQENVAEANAWGAERYVALHSNAGMRGTIVFYHSGSPKGLKMAEAIYKEVAGLSPGAESGDRTREWDGLIEIHGPDAPAVLVELEAHDWKIGVDWLTGKRPAIAQALYEGICRGVGLEPKDSFAVDYRPLKRAAIAVADQLKIPHGAVDADARGKGAAFETLLRAIAGHQDSST